MAVPELCQGGACGWKTSGHQCQWSQGVTFVRLPTKALEVFCKQPSPGRMSITAVLNTPHTHRHGSATPTSSHRRSGPGVCSPFAQHASNHHQEARQALACTVLDSDAGMAGWWRHSSVGRPGEMVAAYWWWCACVTTTSHIITTSSAFRGW